MVSQRLAITINLPIRKGPLRRDYKTRLEDVVYTEVRLASAMPGGAEFVFSSLLVWWQRADTQGFYELRAAEERASVTASQRGGF